MKKQVLTFILIFSIIAPLSPAGFEELWGLKSSELIIRLNISNFSTFKPGDNPSYNNRIIDFFSTINPEVQSKITILRYPGKPERDFCFFNERLYSISEEWDSIDMNSAQGIINAVKEKYPLINVDEKTAETVYNLKMNKTKVYLHRKTVDKQSVNIRIYYYSTDLFGILIRE
ncbi:MAG: hypothetical protein CVV49_02165 [Spirochaetae bacterium HGW-Spirochaetae-5]|nr:MAG: hypothetical protein CVV49_02165 [Spirochaetae bacterium HGW-Spirochaetae-5]